MVVRQDKCLNCGASIDYSKIKNRVYKCPYCRQYYHIDEYGMIEEYKVKLRYMGRDVYCYLGSVSCEYLSLDSYRNLNGKMTYLRYPEPQLTFELVSYKIEEADKND